MLKLYRISETKKDYWETWEVDKSSHIVHWGELGTRGESRTVKSTRSAPAQAVIQQEVDARIDEGFVEIDAEDHAVLIIEYAVDGMGSPQDLDKRTQVEDRMNDTLGWTGLGACDGGSIGSGTMEVCCFVVDFDAARRVITEDLAGTAFGDFIRIYDEGAD